MYMQEELEVDEWIATCSDVAKHIWTEIVTNGVRPQTLLLY